MKYEYIAPDKIKELLFDDMEYLKEFCDAGQSSFSEFKENFHTNLVNRNMGELRKAGHKIKPGAQMMGADIVVEEYEKAKNMLKNDGDQEKLEALAEKMDAICDGIMTELNKLANNIEE